MRLDLLTEPDLSAVPPRATNASTRLISERITILIFLSDLVSVNVLSFLFDLGCVIEQD